ncbi:MAG: hypothetical protein ACOYBL_13635 [Lachnospiraceae bacterium]|jgi:hypothetical protein
MVTTGLGAGSYPESKEYNREAEICERCGDEYGLKNVDGAILCRDCRAALYLDEYKDRRFDFILSDDSSKIDFVEGWLECLSDAEKAEVLMDAFKSHFSLPLPEKQAELDRLLQSYVEECKSDFTDYLDNEFAKEC